MRQKLDEAEVFKIDIAEGLHLTVSVFEADKPEDEDFIQIFDREREQIISIDASIWKRIVRAVDRRLQDRS